jgi:hypothetical protein
MPRGNHSPSAVLLWIQKYLVVTNDPNASRRVSGGNYAGASHQVVGKTPVLLFATGKHRFDDLSLARSHFTALVLA